MGLETRSNNSLAISDELSVFDHFVGLALKALIESKNEKVVFKYKSQGMSGLKIIFWEVFHSNHI